MMLFKRWLLLCLIFATFHHPFSAAHRLEPEGSQFEAVLIECWQALA